MQVEIIRSKRKTLSLQVKNQFLLQVRAPGYLSDQQIQQFISQKRAWISQKQEHFQRHPGLPSDEINEDGFIYLLGQRCPIKVSQGKRCIDFNLVDGLQIQLLNPDQSGVARIVNQWRRQYATTVFQEELTKLHQEFPVSLPKYHFSIRKMRRQWGNCSREGHIKLNLELIRYPMACINYVIQHELCHLIHFNHGAEFYSLQTRVNPDWLESKQQLQRLSI